MALPPQTVLMLTAAAGILWMLWEYLRRRRTKCAAFLLGTFSGIASLVLCHFYGAGIGFTPPLTLCTLGIAAAAGIPGVILLAVMQLLGL